MSSKNSFCFSLNQIIITCFLLLFGFQTWAQPSFTASFAPNTIGPGSITTLTFTINNTDPVNPVTDLAFVNTLPAGVVIATPAMPVSECINGLVVAPEGGTTLSLNEGRVSANTSCSVKVNVTSATIGTHTNTSGDLTSDAGNSGPASTDLTVVANRPGFSKSFFPSTVNFGDRSTLTFTIDNSLNPNFAFSVTFTDNLPLGMTIANPSNLATDCPQPATITASPGAQQLTFFSPGLITAGTVCTVSVDVLAQARGRLNNTTGELTSSSGGPTVSSGKAGDVLVVNSVGDIQLTQSFLDDPVVPGDQVALQFNLVSLNRNFNINNISFTDDLDATLSGLVASGLPLTDVCGVGSQLSGTSVLTLSGANLGPEDSCSFSVILQVPAGSSIGAFPNMTSQPTGQITGQPTNGNVSTDTLFVNFAPQLSKSFTPNSIQGGDSTIMEFTLTNPSLTEAASNISFRDNLSNFLSGSQVSALPANGFCGPGSTAATVLQSGQLYLLISGGNLTAGNSCTFSVSISTAQNTPPDIYHNITEPVMATITGQQYTGKMASADLAVQDIPQLNMLFTDDPVSPGGLVSVEYQISVAEEGSTNATNITFNHDLDATLSGLTAVGLPMDDVCGPGSQITGTSVLSLSNGSINGGSPCLFSISLQVPAAAQNGIYPSTTSDLTATVNSQSITSGAAIDNLQVSSLHFNKQFIDDPSLPGDTVTLEYTIENLSPTDDATGIFYSHNLTDVLNGLTALAPLPVNPCGAGSTLSGTNFLIFTGGNLTANSSCTFSVTLNIPLGAVNNLYNSVTSTLTATVGGSNLIVPAANDTLSINNNLLLLSKSYLTNPSIPGGTNTLEFTLTNINSSDAITGITFTDDLDASLSNLVASGLPLNDVCGTGSQISGTSLLTLTGGNLAANASCTFTVDVNVPVGIISGTYTNTTSTVTGTLNALPVIGDPASGDLLVGFIHFTKLFAGPVNTGETTTLSFSLINNDTTVLNDLAFTDDLDAVLSGLVAVGPFPVNPCGIGSQISGSNFLTLTNGQLTGNSNCSFDVTVQVPTGLSDATYTNVTSELFQSGVPVSAPATAVLTVNGVPLIDVSVNSIDFGSIEVGNSAATQSLTVTNNGTADLTVSNITTALSPFNLAGSGSCPAAPFILAAGNNCTLAFDFIPLFAGVANQNINLTSNAHNAGSVTLQLLGNGLQAELAFSTNPLNFGIVELNTNSATTAVTLTNNGTADLDVTAITAANGDFSLQSSSCGPVPFSLTPTSSCALNYQFNPSSTGIQSQNITINSDSATTPDILVLQGEGVQASIGLSTTQLTFPNTTINTTSTEQLITISNNGLIELNISAVSVAAAPFIQSGGTCSILPVVLAINESCTLGFQFNPTATGGFNQTMTLNSNASSSPDNFDLVGTGIEPGLQLSNATLDFQSVDINSSSTPLSLSISNTGVADLIITNIDLPSTPFSRSGGSCGSLPLTLITNQSCTLEYQFTPTSSAVFSQTIGIESNATTSPDGFDLIGSGIEPNLTISSGNLDFGSVIANTTSNTLTMTLNNTGPGELTIDNLDQAALPFQSVGGSCGSLPIVLSSNQTCGLDYQFMPLTSGSFNQTIGITSNAASSPDTFDLMGNGIEVVLSSSNTSLSFTFTAEGDYQSQTVTLTSAGTDDLTITGISSPAAPYGVDFTDCGTIPITLNSGSSCELIISYTTETSASNSSILITSDDPNSPLEIVLSGSGLTDPVFVPVLDSFGLWILLLLTLLTANFYLLLTRRLKTN